MKKKIYLISLIAMFSISLLANEIEINFAATGASTNLETITVENITKNESVVLQSTDVLVLTTLTNINTITENQDIQIISRDNKHELYFNIPISSSTVIKIIDNSGKTIISQSDYLQKGSYSYEICGLQKGIYYVSISGKNYSLQTALVSKSEKSENITLKKQSIQKSNNHLKDYKSIINMTYSVGDVFRFTGTSGLLTSTIEKTPITSETITFYFEIPLDVSAAFHADATNVPIGQTIVFTDESLNSPNSWSWEFGDGASSLLKNPSHAYQTAGTYSVTLLIMNDFSSDLITKTDYIIVGTPPTANFTADLTNTIINQQIQFTDNSSNSPLSWNWDFGDGSSSSVQNPVHSYSSIGTYNVKLTVINGYGTNTKTVSSFITITNSVVPEFSVNYTFVKNNQQIQFTDKSLNNPISWSWDFGDGSSSTAQNPSHTYTTPGLYSVSLTATNSSNSQTISKTDYIMITNDELFNPNITYGTITDSRDGNAYKTVIIGNQEWFAENLRYLPPVTTLAPDATWGTETQAQYAVYTDTTNTVSGAQSNPFYQIFGVYYNWPAAMNGAFSSTATPSGVQGACPSGWHLPSDAEWTQLEIFLQNNDYNYNGSVDTDNSRSTLNYTAKALATSSGWISTSFYGAIGKQDYVTYQNKSGFTAIPTGNVTDQGEYYNVFYSTAFWTSTKSNSTQAYHRHLENYLNYVYRGYTSNSAGLSIRCVKD